MSEICSTCGLPRELCVCESIAKESLKIKVYIMKKKFGKIYTIVEGFEGEDINLKQLLKKLKEKFACGGTIKGKSLELQGNHKQKVRDALVDAGFSPESIEVQEDRL